MCFARGLYEQALRLTFDGSSIENFGERSRKHKRDIGLFMVVSVQPMVWQMSSLREAKNPSLRSPEA